jgi:hypothetical protein
VRAAQLIVATCLAPDPPARLVLGGATYEAVLRAAEARLKDLESSAQLAGQADFPVDVARAM